MKIKKIAIGNLDEAYIEDRLKDGVNIIFSNENNKGKTLLMQTILYAIGNDPVFPESFNYRDYYFYIKAEIEKNEYEFLRTKNSVIIIGEKVFQICNSIKELKYFFDQEIYTLPRITKEGNEKIVDLSLIYEIFFLGQDKRNTSKLISSGQYNKDDFKNMLFSMMDIDNVVLDKFKIKNLKEKKVEIESKIKALKKRLVILKANPKVAEYALKNIKKDEFEEKRKVMESINRDITKFRTEQIRESNRKLKLENLLIELNSLNRNLDVGKIKCADCGGDRIIFNSSEFNFEISNTHVRRKIIESIKEDIRIMSEVIDELEGKIFKEQEQLNKEILQTPPDYRDYMVFSDEIINDKKIDSDIWRLDRKLEEIKYELQNESSEVAESQSRQRKLMSKILKSMKEVYSEVNENGVLKFTDLFTKNAETYSGSEEQEFYFSKIIALNNVLKHNFPIIIDSFRDGELASRKEENMLKIYKNLRKQVILTATLKDEEYKAKKYKDDKIINVIDYSDFSNSKILQESFKGQFAKILEKFEIVVE